MKKIKEIWDSNRIVLVLSFVIIICFVVIFVIGIKLFVGVNSSPYGDRLEGLSEHAIKDEDKSSIIDKYKENESVKDVDIHAQGKILYIKINFEGINLDKAKEIVNKSLETYSEDIKNNYDLEFILLEESTEEVPGFTIMGAKNIHRNNVIWNNNTPYEVENEENE